MANFLRPRRGKKATAIEQNVILKHGEVFFETPDAGMGKGTGRIKIGDNSTPYGDLPYFINPDDYAKSSLYSDTAINLGRKKGSTVGNYSSAVGYNVEAAGDYSHSEGCITTASGKGSHAEGFGTYAPGNYSHAEGSHTVAREEFSHAGGYGTEALRCQYAIGYYNDSTLATANNNDLGISTGTAFVIGNGTSAINVSNAFRVTSQGSVYAKAAYNATGADYAEFAEWADGNPDAEDRRGYFVTFDDNKPNMIRKANEGEYVLGIISSNPCVIGNSDEGWIGKYVFDDFGAFVYEEVEVDIEYIDEETGKTKTKKEKVTTYKLNPDYDPDQEYIHRSERKEWDYVGWIGVLSVRDDGTCTAGGYCKVANGGIATASERGVDTYRVLERVSDNVIKVALK